MKSNQKGAVLILTLILLTVFLIASIGLYRSVAVNVTTAGNYSWREAALTASDSAISTAKTYLTGKTDLTAAEAGKYSPILITSVDANGAPWPCSAGNWDCVTKMPLSSGYYYQFFIERLCQVAVVTTTGTQCQVQKPIVANGGSYSLRGGNQDGKSLTSYPILYRVTVNTHGPKSTLVTTQTVLSK